MKLCCRKSCVFILAVVAMCMLDLCLSGVLANSEATMPPWPPAVRPSGPGCLLCLPACGKRSSGPTPSATMWRWTVFRTWTTAGPCSKRRLPELGSGRFLLLYVYFQHGRHSALTGFHLVPSGVEISDVDPPGFRFRLRASPLSQVSLNCWLGLVTGSPLPSRTTGSNATRAFVVCFFCEA